MENCDHYLKLMKRRGQSFMFRHCPMRVNRREMPEAVSCDERGILLMLNQVDSPPSLSLHTLAPPELRTAVAYLREQARPEGGSEAGVPNRETWGPAARAQRAGPRAVPGVEWP
jgi:hypothetical protein